MHTVLASLCTGCELCVAPCPVDCIRMVPRAQPWRRRRRRRPPAANRERFAARNARTAGRAAPGRRCSRPASRTARATLVPCRRCATNGSRAATAVAAAPAALGHHGARKIRARACDTCAAPNLPGMSHMRIRIATLFVAPLAAPPRPPPHPRPAAEHAGGRDRRGRGGAGPDAALAAGAAPRCQDEVLIALHGRGGELGRGSAPPPRADQARSFPARPRHRRRGPVAALGANVRGFKVGDEVYAYSWDNPQGGFYAEYVAVPAERVGHVPKGPHAHPGGRPSPPPRSPRCRAWTMRCT